VVISGAESIGDIVSRDPICQDVMNSLNMERFLYLSVGGKIKVKEDEGRDCDAEEQKD
jgi:hypothetical protein